MRLMVILHFYLFQSIHIRVGCRSPIAPPFSVRLSSKTLPQTTLTRWCCRPVWLPGLNWTYCHIALFWGMEAARNHRGPNWEGGRVTKPRYRIQWGIPAWIWWCEVLRYCDAGWNFWWFLAISVGFVSSKSGGHCDVILLGYIRSRLRCRDNMLINHAFLSKKTISMILPTDFAWHTFFFGSWSAHRYTINSCFEQELKWYTHDSSQVTARLRKLGSRLRCCFIFWQICMRSSNSLRVRKCGTHFEQMHAIFKLFFRIHCTVFFKISSNDAISCWLSEGSSAINVARVFFIILVDADTGLPLDSLGTAAVLPSLKRTCQS